MSTFVINVTKPIGASDLESLNQKRGIVLTSENVEILNTSYYKKKDSASSQNTGVTRSNVQSGTAAKNVVQGTVYGQGGVHRRQVADKVIIQHISHYQVLQRGFQRGRRCLLT